MPSEDVFWNHQVKIAKSTLKMNDAILGVLGGMTKAEARKILSIDAEKKKMTKKIRGRK